MPLQIVSSPSTNVIMTVLDIIGSKLLDVFYFVETLTQKTQHKVKVALVVLVDLYNLGKCQQQFFHLYH